MRRRAFEAQLASDDELRRYVDELTETAAQLAHAAPARRLPGNLEERIFRKVCTLSPPSIFAATKGRATWIP